MHQKGHRINLTCTVVWTAARSWEINRIVAVKVGTRSSKSRVILNRLIAGLAISIVIIDTISDTARVYQDKTSVTGKGKSLY